MNPARSVRAILAAAIVSSIVLLTAARAASAAPLRAEELTDAQVRAAIDIIKAELYRRCDERQFWEPLKYDDRFELRQKGGWTALAVLALLTAGESYQLPRLRDAIEFLESTSMEGVYAVAMRAHVWAMLPDEFKPKLEKDAQWLLEGFSTKHGGWYYEQRPPPNQIDNSNAQYGALGLWEAAKRGAEIPRRAWQRLEERFVANQLSDGGWNYLGSNPATGSMTAAGLTVLFITQDYLHAAEALDLEKPRPPGGEDRAIAAGLQWMDRNFSAERNPGKDTYFFYYLYGVERVGLASGYKFFGGKDWYRTGAAAIIDRLCDVDAASATLAIKPQIVKKTNNGTGPVDDLSFALMFLSRGRVPVAMNKLRDRDPASAWNNRPRDVANFTAWLREKTESSVNWQIVDLDSPPEQWLDAPLLYFASDQAPAWLDKTADLPARFVRQAREHRRKQALGEIPLTEAAPGGPDSPQILKLKRYLDLGGTMLAVNEGSARAFADSIERIGQVMYPQLEWRKLPADHWAYTMLFPLGGKRVSLQGLSNGVRDLIILSPGGDLPRSLQVRSSEEGYAPLLGNIYLYASERNATRPRLANHALDLSLAAPGAGSGASAGSGGNAAIEIVRAVHSGQWDAEPLALPVFIAAMARQRQLSIRLIDEPLVKIAARTPPPALVIVSGIEKAEFTPAEREAISNYVNAGGVILFETPGGLGEFTAAAEEMGTALFNQPIESLTGTRILTGKDLNAAANLTRVEYRPYAYELFGARDTTPRLRGMTINGQPRVLFSREDISHGLLDQPVWGVSGYAPSSARDLLGNIVQHAAALLPREPRP